MNFNLEGQDFSVNTIKLEKNLLFTNWEHMLLNVVFLSQICRVNLMEMPQEQAPG